MEEYVVKMYAILIYAMHLKYIYIFFFWGGGVCESLTIKIIFFELGPPQTFVLGTPLVWFTKYGIYLLHDLLF